jgi:hypothetical protein
VKAGRGSGHDRERFGGVSLGEAQSSNPPPDPEMLEDADPAQGVRERSEKDGDDEG